MLAVSSVRSRLAVVRNFTVFVRSIIKLPPPVIVNSSKSLICGSATTSFEYRLPLLESRAFLSGSSHILTHRNFGEAPGGEDICSYRLHTRKLSKMPPKGMRKNWDMKMKPEDLLSQTEELINKCRKIYDSVGAVADDDVSYESVLKVLGDVECDYTSERYLLDFPQQVSTDQALRDASTEADHKLQAFDVEISMRQDVFNKLLILEKKKEPMKPEAQRFLERLIKLGKRNGLHLPEETQKEMKALKSRMNDLCIQFSKNLNEEATTLEFSDEELEGLPGDFIHSLKRNPDTGKGEVTLKYPHYFPIMRKCKNPETRRLMELAFNTQCINENTPILEELVKLRQKQADLLEFPNHAAYITDLRMAKTAENVYKFLTELWHKLTPLWEEEKQYILELKEKECQELNIPFDGKLNVWDLRYYTTKVEEKKYAVNQSKLREYFPLSVVTQGLLDIYQELLGLKFAEIKNAEVWNEDVQLFSVEDSSNGSLLGYFFLDLFPRTGKYGHAAMFELQPGCLLADGSRQVSVAAMVANFSKPQVDKPSLLDHNEVVTFFHEFGHVMHQICSLSELAHFNGTNVERDFVEAPSQMLENWCWEIVPLKRMSSHYSTGKELPEDKLNALIKYRLANTGYHNLRQIVLAMFDYEIHTNPVDDTKKVYTDIHQKVLGIEPSPGTHFACHFGHLAGGYDAQYYGYLWSEVYSMDMFCTRFKDGNVMNGEVGKEYKYKILQPGGSKDAHDMILDFLGREPTQDAFLRNKGLKI